MLNIGQIEVLLILVIALLIIGGTIATGVYWASTLTPSHARRGDGGQHWSSDPRASRLATARRRLTRH